MTTTRMTFFLWPLSCCLLSGCFGDEESSLLVSPNPFTGAEPVPVRTRKSFTEASIEMAARVDLLGRKILACNPQIGLRPLFRAIGDSRPEIFHIGMTDLVVTDGLVKQCKSEEELAALLCHELGKMVSEREALATPETRKPDRQAPMNVPVGNDAGGTFGPADGTRLAELAKYGQAPRSAARQAKTAPTLPPDPQVLARGYLTKAGYQPCALDTVAPLLREAEKYNAWEKQMTPAPARPFTN